jgi:hypothetical protein
MASDFVQNGVQRSDAQGAMAGNRYMVLALRRIPRQAQMASGLASLFVSEPA